VKNIRQELVARFGATPSWGEVLEDIFTDGCGGYTCEFGGDKTFWVVIRDRNRRAVIPVQVGRTLDEAAARAWGAWKDYLDPNA
jgi:hypothetical protein